jgi:hypothetical protein
VLDGLGRHRKFPPKEDRFNHKFREANAPADKIAESAVRLNAECLASHSYIDMTGFPRTSDGEGRNRVAVSGRGAACPGSHFAAGSAGAVLKIPKQTGKDDQMEKMDTAIAVFPDHNAAEGAVKKLAQAGFDMKSLSIVGKGYHTDDKIVGFYNIGERVKFWGRQGAFWGGLWGLFFGGLFITIPLVGSVAVLGYLATVMITAIENAVVVGGLSALGAAL